MDSIKTGVDGQNDQPTDDTNTVEISNVLLEVDEVLVETDSDQIQNSFHAVQGSY